MLNCNRGNHMMGTLSPLNTKRLFLNMLLFIYFWLPGSSVQCTGSAMLPVGFLYLQ